VAAEGCDILPPGAMAEVGAWSILDVSYMLGFFFHRFGRQGA